MYQNKTFLAFIPARGGSKGIPRKNIIKINNKHLIDYTIEAAIASAYIDTVFVSTDDKEIADISKKCGAEVPFLRPTNLAQDKSEIIDSVIQALNEFAKMNKTFDYVVLLQPTQPLRQTHHIDAAIESIANSKEQSLVSVSKVSDHPLLMRTIDNNGCLQSLLGTNSSVRRQDFPDYYKVNGAIYINQTSSISTDTSFNDNCLPFIMDSQYDVDIDNYFDIEIFKLKLSINTSILST